MSQSPDLASASRRSQWRHPISPRRVADPNGDTRSASHPARRALLLALAILFAAATVVFSILWMYVVRRPSGDLGFQYSYAPGNRSLPVLMVQRESAAYRAGLRAGDRIVAINGQSVDMPSVAYRAFDLGKIGDVLQLTVNRRGTVGPLTIREVIPPLQLSGQRALSGPQLLAARVLNAYPLLFLVVGLPVLFLRLEDRNAWLLALLCGGLIGGALFDQALVPALLRGFAISYGVTLSLSLPAIFYFFFSTFPAPSPIDRRLPWLKWVLLAIGTVMAVPLGVWCLLAGGSLPFHILGYRLSNRVVASLFTAYSLGSYILGLVSLVWNSIRPASADVRRKTRVIVWGTVAGFLPFLVFGTVVSFAHLAITDVSFWIWVFVVALLFLIPLSFAYAVLKHRVLEIPVLLKRSARYLLVQRGFALLTVLVTTAAIVLFITLFSRFFRADSKIALPAAMGMGIAFGAVSAVATLNIRTRISKRIDRAFFRSAYDARQVLENLARDTRKATGREQLAALLRGEINQALHPQALAVYLEDSGGQLRLQHDGTQPGIEPLASRDTPLLRELSRRGEPLEVTPTQPPNGPAPSLFGSLQPECLVPVLAGDGRLTGVLVLGSRLSEEPYSREDKRLLASVATQAGGALETIRLAEGMAERIEAERRIAQEMEFAKQVQARLFPQNLPTVRTLEYAGGCIQARQVGGDYYDFLELRPGRLGLVLADVVGKGVSGALLMANLQANLRSQYAMALEDLPGLLQSVNRLFYENTSDSSYATLFFADYDDFTHRLRYVNCGHPPPLLLRAAQSSQSCIVERLAATSTVLGLFDDWRCGVAEVELAPGDTLVLYTDGVSEAARADGEEFGESLLLDTLRAHYQLPAAALLQAIVEAVQEFSPGQQQDDITLIAARCTLV
jgi:phosphoserine phosphatase RsbU/P